MGRREKWPVLVRTRGIMVLMIGAVLLPAVFSTTVGIITLALWQAPHDIVLGILILTFAATSIFGAIVAVYLLRREARLARLKSEFVASVSHELRTPLASIRLFVESLQSGRITGQAEVQRCLSILAAETARLCELIEGILEFQPVGGIRDEASFETVEEIVEQAVQPFTAPETGGSLLEVTVQPGLPSLKVDRQMIVTALRNLVHNALKYAPDGPILVEATCTDEGVSISVTDHGPGIPEAEVEKIFERFYRLKRDRNEGSGMGLGLAIAMEAARSHCGELSVRSEEQGGATFRMLLPRGDGGGS